VREEWREAIRDGEDPAAASARGPLRTRAPARPAAGAHAHVRALLRRRHGASLLVASGVDPREFGLGPD